MNFRASFCNPFKPDIIEMGYISKNEIIETFDKIPWTEYLAKLKTANQSEIHYTPSLEIENKDNRNGLSVSAVDGNIFALILCQIQQEPRPPLSVILKRYHP